MEITPHLNEAELAEFVSDPSRGLGTHLEFCDACLSEVARLREGVADLKRTGDNPQEFWDQQRAAIRTQLAAAPRLRAPAFQPLAWAPVFALLLLAGLLISGGTPAPAPAKVQLVEDPDHALLVRLEQVMQSNGPAALEPATYFVQEIRLETRKNPRTASQKEINHEN